MAGFDILLNYMRTISNNKSDQGFRFEQLIKKILLTSPLYSEIYEKVWTWNEFPYNENKHDYGIDLVAKKYMELMNIMQYNVNFIRKFC